MYLATRNRAFRQSRKGQEEVPLKNQRENFGKKKEERSLCKQHKNIVKNRRRKDGKGGEGGKKVKVRMAVVKKVLMVKSRG